MRKILVAVFLALQILVVAGCNIINPSEAVPTYVQIDSFSFSGRQLGSRSHKITNVWVYFNSAPVGNFDLPAKIPVIADAAATLTVIPGIDYDGISAYPVIYPLYLADTMTLTPNPGKVVVFGAKTGYNENVGVKLEQSFDGGMQNGFKPLRDGDTTLLTTQSLDSVFEGTGAGKFYLDADHDSTIVLSAESTVPIIAGRDAYIELDYRGTLTMRVGMHSEGNLGSGEYTEQIIGLNPRPTWGKIYVGVKEWISAHQSTSGLYQILLRVDKPAGVSEGYMLVDNIKLVSY